MKVLVLDDDPVVASFISEALREVEKLDVDTAGSLAEAKEKAEHADYDLLVVDVYLKTGDAAPDGLFFVKQMIKKKPGQKAILVTGRSFSKILTEVVFRTGAIDLLAKPIDLKLLLKTVRAVLARP